MKQIHISHHIAGFIYFGIIICFIGSCRKFLDIPPPKDQIQTKEIFKNDQAATSSVSGLYSFMLTSSFWPSTGAMSVFPGLSADELYPVTTDPEAVEFSINDVRPENGKLNSYMWSHFYQTIYHANLILEGLQDSPDLSDAIRKQLRGEMLTVRAMHLFYLYNLYGGIPLTLTTNYELNGKMGRTDPQLIAQHIANDLEEAKLLLTEQYPTAGRVRPNKWTAAALLSRVYLYQHNWQKAEREASAVINSGSYSLVTELQDVFLANSNETIWSLMREQANTFEGQVFIPIFSNMAPNYGIRDVLLNAFEPADNRLEGWIASGEVDGQTYFYPYKYKKGYDFTNPPPPVTENYVVFRLAEQYLIRAEARAELGDIPGAQEDLDAIRVRAGLSGTSATDRTSLLEATIQERRVELFAEWGHRWFDLKRWNRAGIVLGDLKSPHWRESDTLYPIPFFQMEANVSLTQNPGY